MSGPRRNSGLIVIGTTTTLVMSGLAGLLMAPIMIGTASPSADWRNPTLDRIGRALDDTALGLGIDGQWRAVDLRARKG